MELEFDWWQFGYVTVWWVDDGDGDSDDGGEWKVSK